MVNRFFWNTFPSMVKWWKGECNFFVGVYFFLRENCPGRKLSLEQILSSQDKILGDMSRGTVPGVFIPWDNYWQHLTHYWGANCPGKCLGISRYFCTYDDTYFISSYAKLCVHYGMFLYICVHYVLGVCPNISQGTRAPCGTRFRSNFIFRNRRSTMSEQKKWWHRAKTSALLFFALYRSI